MAIFFAHAFFWTIVETNSVRAVNGVAGEYAMVGENRDHDTWIERRSLSISWTVG